MFKHDFTKIYSMVTADERKIIIDNIDTGNLVSECSAGIKNKWWKNKHHPDKDIPKNIYWVMELFKNCITGIERTLRGVNLLTILAN
jgi:hypothetical protein